MIPEAVINPAKIQVVEVAAVRKRFDAPETTALPSKGDVLVFMSRSDGKTA
jgi:hypothetical protein